MNTNYIDDKVIPLSELQKNTKKMPKDLNALISTGLLKPSANNITIRPVSVAYTTNDKVLFEEEGGIEMSNEYQALEQKMELMMKHFDEKIANQEKLTDAKFETVLSKMETFQASILGEIKNSNTELSGKINSISADLNHLKSDIPNQIKIEIEKIDKENKKEMKTDLTIKIALATVIATVAIPIIQHYFT